MSHQGRFDGFTVDQFQARFAGTFDVEDYDAMQQGLDGEVMFVVVAKVKGATITETPAGDVRRVNSLGVKQVAAVRKAELREELAELLGLDLPMQLPFPPVDASSSPAGPSPQPTTRVLAPPTPSAGPSSTGQAVGSKKDALLVEFLETGS